MTLRRAVVVLVVAGVDLAALVLGGPIAAAVVAWSLALLLVPALEDRAAPRSRP